MFQVLYTILEVELETPTAPADFFEGEESRAERCESLPFHQSDLSLPAVSVMFHDYRGQIDMSSILYQNQVTAACQTECPTNECAVQTDGITVGFCFGKSVGTQTDDWLVAATPLRFEHVADKPEVLTAFTGVPNVKCFQAIFEEFTPMGDKSAGRKCSLRLIDQMLMTFMRLRLGLVITDLSFRFQVSKTTCSKVINKWIDHLFIHLSFLQYWPTRKQINNTMPQDFKEMFPRTRVVIDCTELYTETPQSLANKSLMYSQYKTHMTWKALIGVTPNGVVSFVSDFWAGSISDKQIFIKSGIIDLCEKGDAVMGDKGFIISDITTPKGIDLIIPPKKDKAKQMPKKDIVLTRRVANCRIHIERHNERVKNFRVLNNLTGTMKASVSKIWKLCNYLTALMPPLHPHDSLDEENLVADDE